MSKVVIVGGSHAGVAVADSLRRGGFDGSITMICDEAGLPYQRPPLSKEYMAGAMTLDRLHLRGSAWYEEQRIDLVTGEAATGINRTEKTVTTAAGRVFAYDNLVLATGASPRQLPADVGGTLTNVHKMRDLSDADTLMAKMAAGKALVVIGGGYIGLEAAAEAAKKGLTVTVIEAADRILRRVACKETADAFRALHESHGVTIIENMQIDRIADNGSGACRGVVLADGREIPADLVIVGIGVVPNAALAEAAGLDVAVGVTVDDHARTSDPSIYACGDVTVLPFHNTPTRLESVQNANDQAGVVAANICGTDTTYHPEPWFWSDQYDMKLQIAGLNRGYDTIVTRAGKREGAVSHFYFHGDRFLAVDCMNDAATYVVCKRMLSLGVPLTPAQAADPEANLKAMIRS